MTREDSNPVESTTTDRRDYLRILLALAGVGALSTSATEVAKAAHNSDAPYPSGAWGYAGTAGHGESERPSIAELEAAWNETYHVLHQDVDVGSRWYAEDGYSEWDFLHSAWDGLEFPGDTEYPAGTVTIQQDTTGDQFRIYGVDDDASHFREATIAWNESLFPGDPLVWDTAADWDAFQSQTGIHHVQPTGTDFAASDVLEKGYEITDEGGSNLLAYYPLEEDSGSTANDVGPNGDDGVINGATLNYTPAPFGHSAYDFDGIDDGVTVSNSNVPAGEGTDEITVSFWINIDDTGTSAAKPRIVTQSGNWFISSEGNSIVLRTFGGNTGTTFPGLTQNKWQHVVLIWDCGTDATLVLDGNGGTTASISDTSSGGDTFTIGDDGTDDYLDGKLAHVRVYDRLLSVTEAQNLYAAAVGQSEYWTNKQVAVGTNSTITVTTHTTIPSGTSIDLHLFEDVGNDNTGAGTDALGNNYDNTDNANLTAGNDQTVDLIGFDGGGDTNAYWLHIEPDVTNNDPTTTSPTVDRVEIAQ